MDSAVGRPYPRRNSVSTPLHFSVDPRLIELLGAQYRSTEEALKELVANAWDADATEVSISLPEPLTISPVVVADNGYGM
ncbi:MAG TPA: ATP-binding protein, partial [Jatrophihabitantaceae bacterium]|nr:ATP-binding protein [Jatrophihabitantaceae bacterium]